MHLIEQHEISPLESESELRAYFEDACKPREQWRIGTEREIIGVRTRADALGAPIPYDGGDGLRAVLDRLAARGWAPVLEGDHIIALVRGDSQVSYEPGGQLELAARPLVRSDELRADLDEFGQMLIECSEGLDLGWLGMGFRPFGTRDDVSWMPKDRYVVMRSYLGPRGRLAHEMMKRTATVQVNLDYSDVEDAGEKMRAAMSVSSILTAIYAYSPIVDGADSGYQSYRTRIWRDTDADRCGLLPFAFDGDDVFARYIDWALDVPLFFVYRDGYQPAGGMTFRRFLREGFQGHRATMDDWALHLSTLFPEVRMKRFLEIRGCDSGSRDMALALAPLCHGFLYDATARQAAIELTAGLDFDQRNELWDEVARAGLRAHVPGTRRTVGELAREFLAIVVAGLERSAPEELPYLEPVRAIVESGRTQADALIELWNRVGGDPAQVIAEVARGT